ncbi:MAG: Fur family transcriptional regulator [Dehalococcoidia bacterium]|nr:Fur family transcriptional regulator [Dehalococcoidia bacterium]
MNLFGRKSKQPDNQNRMNEELGKKGLRMTPQRLMIIAAIEKSDNHIGADEIYTQVVEKYPNVNISTVYRTLDVLEEMGMVTKTDLGGGRVQYHPAEKGHHHHLVCRECGKITDLDEAALSVLKETLLRHYNFVADLRHMGIWGYCAKCNRQVVKEA